MEQIVLAAEAHWLRLECGLVGAMVGGVAGAQRRRCAHGALRSSFSCAANQLSARLLIRCDVGPAATAAHLPCRPPPPLPTHRRAAAAGFKQQNAVHGLPLQLGEEEITLALEKGVGCLCVVCFVSFSVGLSAAWA